MRDALTRLALTLAKLEGVYATLETIDSPPAPPIPLIQEPSIPPRSSPRQQRVQVRSHPIPYRTSESLLLGVGKSSLREN